MADRTCTVEGCDRPVWAPLKGWCAMHYRRWKIAGDVGSAEPQRNRLPDVCKVDGCERRPESKDLCGGHYKRLRKTGDVSADIPLGGNWRRTPDTCSVDGCGNAYHSGGYCIAHYRRLRKRGTVDAHIPVRQKPVVPPGGPCMVDGCAGVAVCKSLCKKHYSRLQTKGHPLNGGKVKAADYVEAVLATRPRNDGCWEDWPYRVNPVSLRPMISPPRANDKQPVHTYVARYVRFLEDGEWPEMACHRCDNAKCWNPDHIYAGNALTNAADYQAFRARRRGLRGEIPTRTDAFDALPGEP